MNTKSRFWISIFFILWLTGLLAAFFIVQKPAWAGVLLGLGNLLATISLWLVFVFSSIGLGYFIFDTFFKLEDIFPYQKVTLSLGLGMGIFGLLGFLFAVNGLGNKWFLLMMLLLIFVFTWRRYQLQIIQECKKIINILMRSTKYAPRWIPLFSAIVFSFSFLLALAPPIEAFDGLLYHLTVPTWWLRDGSVQLINLPHYWFPSLLEGMFIFPLSLGLESATQLIHWTFVFLTICLIWGWTQEMFGSSSAWWAIAIAISMPSLPWLASWAYTDFGLVFYSLSTLLIFSKWQKSVTNFRLLAISGLFCGFAVGIKYTAFILPITCCLFLLWNLRYNIKPLLIFVIFSVLSGGVWYLRNLIWTGNPFYPFVFGGPFWDSFRAEWYAGSGTGIGFNFIELLLLPFVTTFGFRDENFFDGRIGPFYLILLPVMLFVIWKIYKKDKTEQTIDASVLFTFGVFSIAFWVFGVIRTSHLMQARLLLPALMALLPLFGKSILSLETLDTPKFRFRFVLSMIMAITVFVFILDFSLLTLFRNPIMVAIGSESRISYMERLNGTYAQLLTLAERTPPDAYVYLINEPRSYGINRLVQPDPINDNLPHDFYLHSTNVEVITSWKQIGYTHVLTRSLIFDHNNENQHSLPRLEDLKQMLIEIDQTEEYILYQIP